MSNVAQDELSDELHASYLYGGPGVEEEDTSGGGMTSPFDPTLIRVETRPLTIDLLLARIRENELDMAPDFQRKGGIWRSDTMSRLIESILIRIPLPAFYMDATNDDRWVVVDGLQRLTTLKRFVIDKTLKLTGLDFLESLEGKSFDEIPRNYQRRILETQITAYLISRGTPEEVKFNIFKRINTGGLPLSPQEIRHALNQGPAARLITRLAQTEEFKCATAWGVSDDRMADREFVLRFLAFTITPYTEYKVKDFDKFLNDAMARMNKMRSRELEELEQQFLRAMNAATGIFDNEAFRKRYSPNSRRKLINKPLFDTWSVNLSSLNDEQLRQLEQRKFILRSRFIDLLNEQRTSEHPVSFDDSISFATGDILKVRMRFSRIQELIQEVLT
ncbi:MAG: DUF262 domain-containing protein [Herpetosiphonaceae bacterium]|nr:DUF262 domain-containing protein [Herpetosiphonaceae bacterium]